MGVTREKQSRVVADYAKNDDIEEIRWNFLFYVDDPLYYYGTKETKKYTKETKKYSNMWWKPHSIWSENPTKYVV